MQYSKRLTQYVCLHHESLMEMHFERQNIHTKTTTLTTTITTTTNYHYHLFYYRQDGIHLCITQSLHYIQYSQGKCRGFSTEMRPWPKHTLSHSHTLFICKQKAFMSHYVFGYYWTEVSQCSTYTFDMFLNDSIQHSSEWMQCRCKEFPCIFSMFCPFVIRKVVCMTWLLDVCRYIKCREYCCFSVTSVSLKC